MNTKAKVPIYRHIKQRIREEIEGGRYKAGDRVPSEQELARELGVSRGQARQALRDLQMEGYLTRSRGRGSFVTSADQWSLRGVESGLPTVTVAMPFTPTQYLLNVVKGLAESLKTHGLHCTFYYLTFDPASEHQFLRKVASSNSAALALWPCFRSQEECDLVADLCASHYPCVTFDRYLPMIPVDYVGTDNRSAFEELAEVLLQRGHTRIGYLTRDLADSVMEDRLNGFMHTVTDAGIPFHGMSLRTSSMEAITGGLFAEKGALLRQFEQDTAICCSDEETALTLLKYMDNEAPHLRESMTIAMMYDGDLSQLLSGPSFLAMCQDGHQVGWETGALLAQRILDPKRPVEHRLIPARFTPARQGTLASVTAGS